MKILTLRLFTLAALLSGTLSASAEPPTNTNGTPYAIGGYDVVAYFTDHAPREGKREHASTYLGATWLFASAEHKLAFDANPKRYLPAFAGYCAYGVANGRLVKIDPNAWTIREGTLYLNYSLDVRTKWLEDPAGYIERAKREWKAL